MIRGESDLVKDIAKKKKQIKEDKKELEVIENKKKTLNVSIKEGAANSVKVGFGHSFMTPFALALNASNFQIGFLASFIGLVGPLAQLGNSHLMEKYERRKIVMSTIFIANLLWIPIILLGLMFYFKIWLAALPVLLIIFYSIHIGIGAVAGPAWFSWMGDLVPKHKRGRYFSRRNRITGAVAIVSMLIAGFLLDFFKTKGFVLTGFTILFSIAMVSRFYSVYLFKKHYAPKIKLRKGYYFSFYQFIHRSLKNNFGKFAVFVGLIHLAAFISSPFVAVYMLKELEFSYIWFTVITLSASVFSLAVLPFWGKFTDKYGNRLTLFLCAIFIPLVPILWIFSTSKLYLILVPSLIGGVFWAGFGLASVNFIYDSVKQEHRALCSTYYNVLIGVGVFIGSIVGGAIAKYSSVKLMGSIFLLLFLISGIARAVVAFLFLPHIKEIRHTRKPPLLVKEHRFLQTLGHQVNHFNSSITHYSHIPEVRTKQLGELRKIFVKK